MTMRRPRVDLVAPPFAGHLHPLLACGRALAEEFEVRVVSGSAALPDIDASGLSGVGLLAEDSERIARIAAPTTRVGSHPLRLFAQFDATLDVLGRFAHALDVLYAEAPPDLMIADFTLPVAGAVAQRFGLPWWTSHPSPCVIESPDGPPAYLGGLTPGSSRWHQLRDAVGRMMIRAFKRTAFALRRDRIRALGLAKVYRDDGSEAAYSSECILGFGDPRIEFPCRRTSALEIVGPALFTPPRSRTAVPPFTPGARHVLVTLGTHLGRRLDALLPGLVAATHKHPDLVVHVSAGRVDDDTLCTQGRLHRIGYVDYQRFLGCYALVLHHGGAGILHHALAAGVPSLVWPQDYDQFDTCARLLALNLGRRLPSPDMVASALDSALVDHALAARCRAWAATPAPDGACVVRDRVRAHFCVSATSALDDDQCR